MFFILIKQLFYFLSQEWHVWRLRNNCKISICCIFSIAKHLIFKNFSPRNIPQSKVELILKQQMNNMLESNGNTWTQLSKNIGHKPEKNRGNKEGPSVLTEGMIIKGTSPFFTYAHWRREHSSTRYKVKIILCTMIVFGPYYLWIISLYFHKCHERQEN